MPVHLLILGLAWDETTEEHINNRLTTDDLEEFIQRGQYLVFPNTAGHSPGRYKLIGTMPSGLLWTVILEEARDGNPEQWIPITAFRSSAAEAQIYRREMKRQNRKGGGTHV